MKHKGDNNPESSKEKSVISPYPWNHNTGKIPLGFIWQSETAILNKKDWTLCFLVLHFEALIAL